MIVVAPSYFTFLWFVCKCCSLVIISLLSLIQWKHTAKKIFGQKFSIHQLSVHVHVSRLWCVRRYVCIFVCMLIKRHVTPPACRCNERSTSGCEMGSGRCICKPQFTGENCDRCADGYYYYPQCIREFHLFLSQTALSFLCLYCILFRCGYRLT